MSLYPFHQDTLPVTPWKNGGGATREIACWPAGTGLGDFGWRVSIALIAAAGPFSVFGGVDRHIMLLAGDGVRLQSGDGRVDHCLDTPHVPFPFSGDATIDCSLLGRASSDFNVMTRRGQWHAEVQVLNQFATTAPAPHGVLLVLRGSWRLDAQSPVCHAGAGLYWTDEAHTWQVAPQTPDALLTVVRFIPD
jgi:environmental stress-induced protein Ves